MKNGKSSTAFGRSLEDLARAGHPPVVLLDCLRWLAKFALNAPNPFTSAADKRKLLALKQLYDSGKRPLRNKAASKDPVLVANLLLLWLGALPEPLFPAEYVPELLKTQQSDCYAERVAAVRSFLKKTEPFILEALFPLFEFLHHHLINQADRDATLQELGRMFAPFVFGSPQEYALPPEDTCLLADTVELLIAEYRPLFTQPYGLNRYQQDSERAAAAAAAKAAAAAQQQQLQLAVVAPLALGTLPAVQTRPVSSVELSVPGCEGDEDLNSLFWSPFSCFSPEGSPPACSPRGSASSGEGSLGEEEDCGQEDGIAAGVDGLLHSLLESTVSSLFELEDSLVAEALQEVLAEEEEEAAAALALSAGNSYGVCAGSPSPNSKAQPMAVPARSAAAGVEQALCDGVNEFAIASMESFASEDWGSFSPTGFLLSDSPPTAAAAAAAAAVAGHQGGAAGVWGCKSSAAHMAAQRLGSPSGARVMA